jgi:DNA processing protein
MIPLQLQSEPLAAALALWRVVGIGPSTFHKIQAIFSDLREVFSLNAEQLQRLPLKPETLAGLCKPDWQRVERDLLWANEPNHHLLYYPLESYPSLLREISAPPPLLFVKGRREVLQQHLVAIVGSRNPTPHGAETAFAFASELASQGWVISSGLALGIDYQAHRGALAAGGTTLAVMGTGMDHIYPARHRDLAEHIAIQGALVTEFPLGVRPDAHNFPRRNRILSGLSVGVLVVEAALKSGSLITARYANEQGREVFAIPGSIHNPLAKGCHHLLRSGAKLVETSQDIQEELQTSGLVQRGVPISPLTVQNNVISDEVVLHDLGIALDYDNQLLIQSLAHEATPIEILVNRTGFSVAKLTALLARLELNGQVVARAGAYSLHANSKIKEGND